MTDATPDTPLATTLAQIQSRWGRDALRRLQRVATPPTLSTGFPLLDRLTGGLPAGCLTELIGPPTTGATSIALHIIAQAQAANRPVLYVDCPQTLDPTYAAASGVALDDLIVAHPTDGDQTLRLLADVAQTLSGAFIIVDAPPSLWRHRPAQFHQEINQLGRRLRRRSHTLLWLTAADPHRSLLTEVAQLRLLAERKNWLYVDKDILGYQVRVTLWKHPTQPAGAELVLNFTWTEGWCE